jgi:ketosteroid isomerase-like protein
MALWTEDAVFMPMDEPTITGREAIGRHIQDFIDQSPGEIEIVPAETRVAGAWAFERGTEIVTMRTDPGGPAATIDIKYLVILQRQPDGSWKYARYIYNLEEPFPEPDAPVGTGPAGNQSGR